jgi:hypothetical protein
MKKKPYLPAVPVALVKFKKSSGRDKLINRGKGGKAGFEARRRMISGDLAAGAMHH